MANYAAIVEEKLLSQGFVNVRTPSGEKPGFLFALHRAESWGRLLLVLADAEHAMNGAKREWLVRSMAAWAQSIAGDGEQQPCYVLLALPFLRRVDDAESAAMRAMQQEGPDQRWGVIPWVVDLESGLVDRHSGFPQVGDTIAQILTDVPREQREETAAAEAETAPVERPAAGRPRPIQLATPHGVTQMIIVAAVAYYLLSVLMGGGGLNALFQGPSTAALRRFGANDSVDLFLYGEQWRLLTAMFLHMGVLHIVLDVWVLWQVGRFTELLFGSRRMAFIYLVAGIVGSLAGVALRSNVILFGAGNAIFGLMGALLYFGWRHPGFLNMRGLWVPVAINLGVAFLVPGMDKLSPFFGLLGGIAAAFIAGVPGEASKWRTVATVAVTLVIVLLLTGIVPVPYVPLF